MLKLRALSLRVSGSCCCDLDKNNSTKLSFVLQHNRKHVLTLYLQKKETKWKTTTHSWWTIGLVWMVCQMWHNSEPQENVWPQQQQKKPQRICELYSNIAIVPFFMTFCFDLMMMVNLHTTESEPANAYQCVCCFLTLAESYL